MKGIFLILAMAKHTPSTSFLATGLQTSISLPKSLLSQAPEEKGTKGTTLFIQLKAINRELAHADTAAFGFCGRSRSCLSQIKKRLRF